MVQRHDVESRNQDSIETRGLAGDELVTIDRRQTGAIMASAAGF